MMRGTMLPSAYRAQTAQAAEIAGVGYEGLRGWLKRGFMRTTGPVLAKMYARDTPAELTDTKRWKWSEFGFADLCAFRLLRVLLDAGLPWDAASGIASANNLWQLQMDAQREDEKRAEEPRPDTETLGIPMLLAVHRLKAANPDGDTYHWCLYTKAQLADDLARDIVTAQHMTLVDLRDLRGEVVARIETLTGTSGLPGGIAHAPA